MARETTASYYCDFCGKESAREEFVTISGSIVGFRDGFSFVVARASDVKFCPNRDFDLCPDCYRGALGAISPFIDFINTKGGRVTSETEEAAHE